MSDLDITVTDGRPEAWIVLDGMGGYVCAEPDTGKPDGICGMPVESEPCNIHHPDAPPPAPCPTCGHPDGYCGPGACPETNEAVTDWRAEHEIGTSRG